MGCLAGMHVAAAFRSALQSASQPGLTQGALPQGQLAEDLFVMSPAGGMVRHRLTLQQSTQEEAGTLR